MTMPEDLDFHPVDEMIERWRQEEATPAKLYWLNMSNWDDEPVPTRKWAILDRVPLN